MLVTPVPPIASKVRGGLVMHWLVETNGGVVPLILRLTLAVVMFPHGAQKTFGWFGGQGFRGTMAFFTKSGFPPALAFVAVMAEFLGPLGLAVGLLTRVAALGIAAVMLVAIMVHKQHGFFMNWFGTQPGEGVEYHLLALGLALALIVSGAGAWSIDALIARW
jgi:putative oxidoreductase